MARTSFLAFVSLGLISLLPVDSSAQKKKADPGEIATDQDYKSLKSIQDMTGKLGSVNLNTLTIRLDIPHMVPNPKYKPPKGSNAQYQQMQNIYRQQAQIMATTNPIQRQQRMQQLMATINNAEYQQMLQAAAAAGNPNNQPFMLAHQYKDYELELSDKVTVSKLSLDNEYDDKGYVKTYTKDEKAELKRNDPSKLGYQAKVEDLQTGQQIKVYLKMPKKTKPAPETEKPADKKDDDKAKVADKGDLKTDKASKTDKTDSKASKDEVIKPLITKILILKQPDPGMTADAAPPKKKKDN
jgi:hypothetical protein